ncbi:MAG: hypothetical protein AAF333_01470 [Planctomycetota bacterium]
MKNHILVCGLAGALLAGPAMADGQIDFVIDNGRVVPSEDFAVMVSVLGAAIAVNGQIDVPVTVQATIGSESVEPWGDFRSAADGDVNDHSPARHYIHQEMLDEGEQITISAKSWLPAIFGGRLHLTVNSHDQSQQVKVLRNGDPAPDITAYAGQSTAEFYVREYLEGGRVNIDENQVIYLFELGTTNVNGVDADFQDLVVLVTLGESVAALTDKLEPLYD